MYIIHFYLYGSAAVLFAQAFNNNEIWEGIFGFFFLVSGFLLDSKIHKDVKKTTEELERQNKMLAKEEGKYFYKCIDQDKEIETLKKEIEELKKSNNRLNYIIQQQEKPNATELQYQEENKKDIIYYTFANED